MFALLIWGANLDMRNEIQPQNLPLFLMLHSLAEIVATYCHISSNSHVNLHLSGCICWLEIWLNAWLQTQTMKMMYTKVADALRDAGLSSCRKPTDYLNFYCLGARETLKPGEPAPLKPPDSNSRQVSRDFLRFVCTYSWAILWQSIRKNRIENRTSPDSVMVIKSACFCWFLDWSIHRSSQLCSRLSVEAW